MGHVAIISDLHSNLEALHEVLADIEKRHVDEILCLGDIIGYGPNPRESIDIAKGFSFNLLGNHEEAVLFLAEDFNQKARQAVDWTRDQLNLADKDVAENHAMWNFLGDLRKKVVRGDVLYVHGSPRIPTREYVMPRDVNNREKMEEIFAQIPHVCFVGHTHVPGVFTDDFQFFHTSMIQNQWKLNARKTLINIGSVGQPRDGDNRASYVTFDGETVEWHRIPYDFEATMQKIRNSKGLPEYLADRLREGR
ncbi:MAG: metallophosphoesterase family protein [Planctomycetales bacterium]|nr:metallophosphoesterase family protein [Planctomycetales bacterium]